MVLQDKGSVENFSEALSHYSFMDLNTYLRHISARLIQAHNALIEHTELGEALLNFRVATGSWSIREIIEHVSLTSHFLLIIIDKSAAKSRRKATPEVLVEALKNATFDPDRLNNIGQHRSFAWERPDHMEPTGKPTLTELIDNLVSQRLRCLEHLDDLRDGAGLLHTTTMTVDHLGRLNTYEYIDFLARHMERHLQQIETIRAAHSAPGNELI